VTAIEAADVLIGFARAGHDAGYPTADLEERVGVVANAFGLPDAEVAATPTTVEISVGGPPHQHTQRLRVRPAAVDLDAIARLDDLVGDLEDGRLDAAAAMRRLDDIRLRPLRRAWPLLLAAYAGAAASLAPVLGGGPREAAAAAGVGLAVGAVAVPTRGRPQLEPLAAPVAAVAASLGAASIVALGLRASPDVVTLAALVTFLPGMTLTIGIRELATEHLLSGVASTASALIQLLGLVFGVAVGSSIAESWFGRPTTEVALPGNAFTPSDVALAVAAGLAFTLILKAQLRDAPVMCAATVLALVANAVAEVLLGEQAAVFAAALAVGLAGAAAGALRRRSPLVFVVPGVLMLVPGGAAFTSALQLLAEDTVGGLAAAFDSFVAALSIAYGLMVASLIADRALR